MLVTALKGLKVTDVACGSGDAQTLSVTENGENQPEGYQIHSHSYTGEQPGTGPV